MTAYDDEVVSIDDSGITIKNYFFPGRPRVVPFADIDDVEAIPLGFATGRHQLVGIGPLRPRLFFHWDRNRAAKSHALRLDLGKKLQFAITPNDLEQSLATIRDGIGHR